MSGQTMPGTALWVLLLAALLLIGFAAVSAQECERCERKIPLLKKCDNLHVDSDYDEQLEKYHACLDKYCPEPTLTEDYPPLIEAREKCAHLAPSDPTELMHAGGLGTSISELVTSPCFHIAAEPTDYFFEATFEAGLGGVEEFEWEGKTWKLESVLTVSLYYDGEQKTLIKTWQSKSSINSASAHQNKMFENSDAVMRQDLPIEKLLWEFEKTPTYCRVRPEKDVVEESEEIDIRLADFTDPSGNSSPEFNRIVVLVDWGEILNGVHPGGNPKAAVYKVGQGSITVKYKAPEVTPLGADQLRVFNSCDIFKEAKMPLAETSPREEIANRRIPLARPGVTVLVTRKLNIATSYKETERSRTEQKDWQETAEITVCMTFAENPEVDVAFDPVTKKISPSRYVYSLADHTVNSCSHIGYGSSHTIDGAVGHVHREVQSQNSQNGTCVTVEPNDKKPRLTMNVDPSTGEVTEVAIPSFKAILSIASTSDCHGNQLRGGRLEPFDCSSSREFTLDFPIGTLSGNSEACWEITGGDGLQMISGGCTDTKSSSRGTTEESYEWVIYRHELEG